MLVKNQEKTKARIVAERSNGKPRAVDPGKLDAFLGKVIGDFGASLSSALTYIGIKNGLYRAMAGGASYTPKTLAKKAGLVERYVREWLINQAAGGYLEYDAGNGTYSLPAEQEVALTEENSPSYVGGGFYVIKAMTQAQARITEAFRKGGGILWGENDPDLFIGTEKFFRPGYATHLVQSWIPAMSGADKALKAGIKVADIGCGHGASTIIMAKAYPKSRFFGFDNHAPSIRRAREAAKEAGVGDRVSFDMAKAENFPGREYNLITFFDCLHDMGNPVGAVKHAREALSGEGSVLIVEPMAGDSIEQNFNPIGRTFSAASTLCCTANSLALGGPALGAVAAEKVLRETVIAGGFKRFKRVTETPFNRIFEARR